MEKIWILFFLVCTSGSHLTSAVYVRSPEEVVVGNGTTDTVCGVPAKTPKVPAGCTSDGLGIINGDKAEPHSWPWQASLQNTKGHFSHFCGGSLINKNWVVTAAHCDVSKSYRVMLGLHDLKNTTTSQNIRVGKVIDHPNYDPSSKNPDYDIALIKLQSPAQMNEHVSPVCVAETGETLTAGMKCVATGWGRIRYRPRKRPLKLRQVCLPIISDEKCKKYYEGHDITSRMICAGASGSGTCTGDSGGPLVCKKKNEAWTLFGITSWGAPSCPPKAPDVFASVPNLRAWMDRTIADN